MRRLLAGLAAVVGIFGLMLQFVVLAERMMADGDSLAAVAWRFVGYFTILGNGFAALVATGAALRPGNAYDGPRVRLAAATAILLIGIVYTAALRDAWLMPGEQGLANHILHDATPLLFLLFWLAGKHGRLHWLDVSWTLVPPVLYCIYAFARGAADGWYAYWFLDPVRLAPGELGLHMFVIGLGFAATGAVLVALDMWLGRRHFRSLS